MRRDDTWVFSCAICDFQVPADPIGSAVMRQHLRDQHGIDHDGTSGRPRR